MNIYRPSLIIVTDWCSECTAAFCHLCIIWELIQPHFRQLRKWLVAGWCCVGCTCKEVYADYCSVQCTALDNVSLSLVSLLMFGYKWHLRATCSRQISRSLGAE